MSHVVTIQTEVRDGVAVEAACRRLRLPQPVVGEFELYSGKVAGVGVRLPGWVYPVVCQLGCGKLCYDNFEGRWGEQSQLEKFLQAYAVEKAKREARRQGYTAVEQQLPGGSIKLTIQLGGGGR